MNSQKTRCGFVSLLGLPNTGKSTLVNALVGQKISIVSSKVQTTRSRVRGIVNHEASQVILIDTPGVFDAKKNFDQAMVQAAMNSLDEADLVIHIIDVTRKNVIAENEKLIHKLEGRKNCILVMNKVDKIAKEELLALSQVMNERFSYLATFMVSALKASGLAGFRDYMVENIPEGIWLFPEDQVTDMPMRLLAAEITREKIFEQLHQELPYAIMVETESWEEFDNGDVKISQVVYVQRDGQKAILLGKGGSQIKKIGQMSREELQEILERRVHLSLFVKVKENWQELGEFYHLLGLEKFSS